MERIQVIFEIFNNEGRTFSGPLEFSDTTPEFKNIVLVPNDNSQPDKLMPYKQAFKILVEKNAHSVGRDDLKCVVDEATREAEKFVYVFSAASDLKFFGFECRGYIHNGIETSIKDIYPEISFGFQFIAHGMITTDINAPSITEIKRKMISVQDMSKVFLFQGSATIADPVARFISLYIVMLHFCQAVDKDGKRKDSQQKVDEALLTVDPTLAQFKSPQGNFYETI